VADAKAGLVITADDRTASAFQSVGGKLNTFRTEANAVAQRAAIAFAAVGAGVTLLTRQQMALIDELAKSSDALRIQTNELIGLQHGADLAGVSSDQLATALQRQNKTLYDASQGSRTATDAIEQLGLKTEDLLGMDTHEQFLTIADAISKVENATTQAGLAQAIYGRSGQDLLPFINQGRDAIEAYADEADRLGLSISRVDAAMVEQANDAITRAQGRIAGLGRVIAVEVSPIIEGLANYFIQATGDADTMRTRVQGALDGIATGVGLVGDAFYGWRLIFAELSLGLETFRSRIVDLVTDTSTSGFAELAAVITGNNVQFQITQTIARAAADEVERARAAAEEHLNILLASEKPSERIKELIAEWRAASEVTAQNTAAIASRAAAQIGTVDVEDPAATAAAEAAARVAEQQRVQLENELEQVRVGLLTREQVEIEAINRRQQIIADAHAADLIGYERATQLSAEISRRGQEELTRIAQDGMTERQQFEAMSMKQRTLHTLGSLAAMTAGTAQSNEKIFKIHKAASLAHAAASLPAAIIESFRNAGGWPWGAVAAAGMAAAGAAQIAAIQSSTFGGGTTPSLAGSSGSIGGQPVPVTPALPSVGQPADRRGEIRVEIYGNNFNGPGGRSDLEDLFRDIFSSAANDRDVVFISHESRQASVIRGD